MTTTYLRRLEGQEDRSGAKVAEADRGLVCDAPPSAFTSSKLSGASTATADPHVARQPRSVS